MYLTAGCASRGASSNTYAVLAPGTVEFADPAPSWSLREIAATLGTAFADPSQPPPLAGDHGDSNSDREQQ